MIGPGKGESRTQAKTTNGEEEVTAEGKREALTIVLMPLAYLVLETSSFDEIIVEFDPMRQCCQPRARKFGQRAEIQSVTSAGNEIDSENAQ